MVALGGNQVFLPSIREDPSKIFTMQITKSDLQSQWSKLADFEIGLSWHCMSQMDSVTIVVTGGYQKNPYSTCSQNSYFYDLIFEKWSVGPKLKEMRAEHACTFIAGRDGKPTAIIAGGYVFPKPSRLQTVEIYNRISNQWESGPNLPGIFSYLQVLLFILLRQFSVREILMK